jgi:hypothetical protein
VACGIVLADVCLGLHDDAGRGAVSRAMHEHLAKQVFCDRPASAARRTNAVVLSAIRDSGFGIRTDARIPDPRSRIPAYLPAYAWLRPAANTCLSA